ncbi:averantin oxidoreductase [Dactylonectria estremocensis]|uniref:Averantin oxidoreductase n=1 Tax=Dactylonectria estremocensis TaxID=1079267 RepID=A0A9P9FCA2_9HYPO|nr:averantin oxidoreductase [Dactylonectria estremocensis]
MAILTFESGNASILVTAFLTGVFLHVGIFRRGEWDPLATKLAATFGIGYVSLIVFQLFLTPKDTWNAVRSASTLFFTFTSGIYSSMVVYRLAFHPLGKFPGPFLGRLSSLYGTVLILKKFQLYKEMQNLHDTYGDVVRIGPSELSVAIPGAFEVIHSNSSPCSKGPWYNLSLPMIPLLNARNKADHTVKRKPWAQGFNSAALRNYEHRVEHHTRLLMKKIDETAGQPLDVSLWCNFYAFDVMGDLAFGKSFNMLKDGVKHFFLELTHSSTILVTLFGKCSWCWLLIQSIPIITYQREKFLDWLRQQVKERAENEPELPDVLSWILSAFREVEKPSKQHELDLLGEANLIVVAGSDTTAAAMTCTLFELACHPEVCRKLQLEIDGYFATHETTDFSGLSRLEYLQAVIDEAFRLHPTVPSGLQRATPPEGLQIGDVFIPGHMIVQIPTYTTMRDDRRYVRPNDFVPERWTTKPDLVKNTSGFAPFSMGRYSCPGKQLALMEIRHVISQIVNKYDVGFAAGQTPEAFIDGKLDGFTLVCPKLDLVFKTRRL